MLFSCRIVCNVSVFPSLFYFHDVQSECVGAKLQDMNFKQCLVLGRLFYALIG